MTGPAPRWAVTYGWDPLLCEILAAALSIHGWRVLQSENQRSEPTVDRVVLIYCSDPNSTKTIKDIQQARAENPRANLVLLSGDIEDTQLLRLIRAGITGHVRTQQGLRELLDALQMACQNRTASSGHITRLVIQDITELIRQKRPLVESALTLRETQVLTLIGKGLSNKEIAESLSIAPNTVKNHVHNLLSKLNARSRHQVAFNKQSAEPNQA